MNNTYFKQVPGRWRNLIVLVMVELLSLFIFFSCSDQANQRRQQSLDDMKAYVKVHKDSLDNYMDKSWDDLDKEFTVKKAVIENDVDKMTAEMRESFNSTVRGWDSVKADYTEKVAEKNKMTSAEKVRSSLAPTGKNPDFTDLTATEIEPEYESFVNIVKGYRDQYSQEDWTVVNGCWKRLNARRREIKDEIPVGDAKKIAKLQLEYTGIKAVNRPFAESEEDK